MKPFGSLEEPLFKKCIDHITGKQHRNLETYNSKKISKKIFSSDDINNFNNWFPSYIKNRLS